MWPNNEKFSPHVLLIWGIISILFLRYEIKLLLDMEHLKIVFNQFLVVVN